MPDRNSLYRSVNTRARGVHRGPGGEYRWSRHARDEDLSSLGSMHTGRQRGRDYTPRFKFLLSRVGSDWDATYSEAISRLDRPEPIFWMVARTDADRKTRVCLGENSFFSGLYVDDHNKLAVVDPTLRVEDMTPYCPCCTHTFNGKPFLRKYERAPDP